MKTTAGSSANDTTTITRTLDDKQVEQREKIADKSIIGTASLGLFGGGAVGALAKIQGHGWKRSLITGGVVAAIAGAASLASAAHSYNTTMASDEDPSVVRTGNSSASFLLGAVGIGATLGGMLSLRFGNGALAGAGASVAKGGMLSKYGVDLTELARKGELPRAFGVDDKVDELMAVLGAKAKNKDLLLHEW